ncbi:MAG: UDP-N-acetylmuramoyl-tripeptide--D-alanyl-D-alanine ligase, partial [Bacteroidales bacterium]|nr:UDP-N-acetylmuramoyl-tripeptide--D-alanyl-D-alanine ligase [Bacteroidales bacterium]
DLVCLVGEEFSKALQGRTEVKARWFATSDELASWLKENHVSGSTILVKGSRGIQMEKVIPEL